MIDYSTIFGDPLKFEIVMLDCPTCQAESGKPCRTPSGRKRASSHDTRPFVLDTVMPKENKDGEKD